MAISKVGCPERKGNHSLTSRCRLKKPEIYELSYVLDFKPVSAAFLFHLLLDDLDKKYRNDIEMDKKIAV